MPGEQLPPLPALSPSLPHTGLLPVSTDVLSWKNFPPTLASATWHRVFEIRPLRGLPFTAERLFPGFSPTPLVRGTGGRPLAVGHSAAVAAGVSFKHLSPRSQFWGTGH